MPKILEQSLDSLVDRNLDNHLGNLQRGLEKESLRVGTDGLLAQTDHPRNLGATLTHPMITTDYSESLLEFVTPVHSNIDSLLNELHQIHHFTYQHLGDEKLWVNSMPCIVESEEKIPIAKYGNSNVAKMKEAYRMGLSYRYGSLMQAIAGIHFNFSMPDDFWEAYFDSADVIDVQNRKSAQYFALIRNFHRISWIGSYLFGASPAVCRTFLRGREHNLSDFDTHSFYAPNATSLRLSGLGYSNDAQSNIEICYNGVDDFAKSLRKAIQTVHPEYEKFGVKVDGEYRQLNANLLQIENEFYSSIRPKRIAASGESPSTALLNQGVQYIEVRSVDLNPFVPIGIDEDCIRFFDTFLLYCMFSESPQLSPEDFNLTRDNQQTMVMNGRDPEIKIMTADGEKSAKNEMMNLLNNMQPVAELLDKTNSTQGYSAMMAQQIEKVEDADLTPSARVIDQMKSDDLSFYEFAMMMAQSSEKYFKSRELNPEINQKFETLARKSHKKQLEIENSDEMNFDEFLKDYFERQNTN